MPIMILGQVIATVGSGLLTTIGISTPTAQWATYGVLSGFGIGLCNNIPYSAVQVILTTYDQSTQVYLLSLTIFQ